MEENRIRRGKLASGIGIVLNFILAAAKIVFGAIFSLVSVIADGVNNLSDCGSGVVSLVSFRISAKPADKEHPYGHQRAEYIASMLIGFLVLLLAAELLRESVVRILTPVFAIPEWGIYVVLGISVFVKAGMTVFFGVSAKRLDSDALKATAVDCACDCAATLAVLAGLLVTQFTEIAADGYAGVVVALFIAWEGVSIVRDAGSKLLGQAPDPALLEKIRGIVLSGESVLGMHDLRVYRYGPHKFFASAHIEMSAEIPALVSHEVIDGIERRIQGELGVEFAAHLDPVDLQDKEAAELEERLRAATEGMVEGLDLHDFRLVRGAVKKLIFEAGVPFSCPKKDAEIKNDLERAVRILGDYEPAVTVERE